MISWHKPGQKVTPTNDRPWITDDPVQAPQPLFGEVYTILTIDIVHGTRLGSVLCFFLVEFGALYRYDAAFFRPVYPEIIEQLRKLPSLTPERAKEDA